MTFRHTLLDMGVPGASCPGMDVGDIPHFARPWHGLRSWAGITQLQLEAFPPCLRYHGILPASTLTTSSLRRQQMLLLTSCTYRALVQLKPRLSLEVAAPPTDMLGRYAAKVGLPIGNPPTLSCV